MNNKRRYYAHTVLGLESILEREIVKVGGSVEERLPGLIQFIWSGDPIDLFDLVSRKMFFSVY